MTMFYHPPCVVIQKGKAKSEMLAEAVIAGAGGRGVILREPERLPGGHSPVFVGLWPTTAPLMHALHREQKPYITVDNGYFRPYPTGGHFRATLNGTQFIYQGTRSSPADWLRFKRLEVELKPWRGDPRKNVLIALQTSQWFDIMGLSRDAWLSKVMGEIERATDRPIVVREKPSKASPQRSLALDFIDAHCVVGLSSNVMLQAVAEGIPVFPVGRCAATPLGLSSLGWIESPLHLPREAAFCHLAANQFTADEIASGFMWKHLELTQPAPFGPLA